MCRVRRPPITCPPPTTFRPPPVPRFAHRPSGWLTLSVQARVSHIVRNRRMAEITGDQRVQSEVLEGLATAVNHRRWFVELAVPYLGDNPIEIGSGLGDYALEWAEHLPRVTATEADPDRLGRVQGRGGRPPQNPGPA